MKIVDVELNSVSTYSQSKHHETPALEREGHADYDLRTWREKSHSYDDGRVFIPAMAFKMALDKAATMLGRKIPGKGNATYTKFFLSGVLCMDDLVLPIMKNDLQSVRIFANLDGVRGSGKRGYRTFPIIPEWRGRMRFHILADEITEQVFTEHLIQAGRFVGIGRFRPEKGGFNGRFEIGKRFWTKE